MAMLFGAIKVLFLDVLYSVHYSRMLGFLVKSGDSSFSQQARRKTAEAGTTGGTHVVFTTSCMCIHPV